MNKVESYFAPAKLNLFLHVTGQRADGYHLLQSLFTLIDFGDTVEIGDRSDGAVVRVNDIPGVPVEADLIVRAARLLQARTGCERGCDLRLIKRTPMGAGLGGGSSDAATVLLALNTRWGLDIPNDQLREWAVSLGADVPFFLFGRSALAEGVGELLTPAVVPSWWYVVLTPPVHVPTPFVFQHPELTRNTPHVKIADFSGNALRSVHNDLQSVVLKAFPVVSQHLNALMDASERSLFGARMTGSGAAVFAAFIDEKAAHSALRQVQRAQPEITGFIAKGLDQHPLT